MEEENNNWVTWLVVIGLIYGGYSLFGGDKKSESEYTPTSSYNTANSIDAYNTSNYGSYDYNEDYSTYEPENPYDEGSGHSAGYEWAEENGVDSCGGNSNSFIEGCEEYLAQQEEYEE